MHLLKTTLTLFVFVLFASCDPGSNIKYEVINKTTQPITVKYQFVFNASGDTSSQEMIIFTDSAKIINQDKPLGYVTDFDQRHDSLFLYWLTIQKGTKLTHQNFKDKKYWRFIKKDEQNATYELIVDTALFDRE